MCVNERLCFCGFSAYIHTLVLWEQHLFYLLHSKQLLFCLPQLQISAIRVITARRRWYQSFLHPTKLPTPHLHLSLIKLERHLIHADHSNLHRLWHTLLSYCVSYWTVQAVRRGGWILMGVAQVASDSLHPWCWRWACDATIDVAADSELLISCRSAVFLEWSAA